MVLYLHQFIHQSLKPNYAEMEAENIRSLIHNQIPLNYIKMVKLQQKHTHCDHRHLIIPEDNKIYLGNLHDQRKQFFNDLVHGGIISISK